MIPKQDLRIGNSVYLIDRSNQVHLPIEKPFVIVELKVFTVELRPSEIPLHKVERTIEVPYSDIHPIPITEEALVKMGFEPTPSRYEEAKTIDYENKIAYINMSDQNIEVNSLFVFDFTRIESVHQFQNFIYALTNTELSYD